MVSCVVSVATLPFWVWTLGVLSCASSSMRGGRTISAFRGMARCSSSSQFHGYSSGSAPAKTSCPSVGTCESVSTSASSGHISVSASGIALLACVFKICGGYCITARTASTHYGSAKH